MVSSSIPHRDGQQVARWGAIIAGVLAFLAGWYAVALGWSAIFLLDESIAMAVFGVVVLLAPVLFTVVTIQALRGRFVSALWFLVPFAAKWLAMSVWAWSEGGFAEFVVRLPGVSLVTMLERGYEDIYPLDQFILVIAQFQVEPFAVIALVFVLLRGARKASRGA